MRRLTAVLVIAALSLVYAACDRVVDLTPDASSIGVPDAAISIDDDAQETPPDGFTSFDVSNGFPDAGTPD